MKLYSYFRSSAAYRVRIALNIKGIEYDIESKSLPKGEHLSPEYRSLNPQGFVPALQSENAVLSQSLAILEYLEERYPTPALLPKHPVARAQVRSMALAIACDIHPLNNLRVLNYLRAEFQAAEESVSQWYRYWIAEGFAALETAAERHSTHRRHCFGDELSLADVLLVPQMLNARRFQTDLTPFPTLGAISSHLEALPAFAAARPEVQPDAA
jgi:maleylacetoacetate isomerase